jgi:hypothetical protein
VIIKNTIPGVYHLTDPRGLKLEHIDEHSSLRLSNL